MNNQLSLAPEQLGPAETLIQTILNFSEHIYHGRPGVVCAKTSSPIGLEWFAVSTVLKDGQRLVLRDNGKGKKKTRLGILDQDGKKVLDGPRIVGEFRNPGLFPEAAVWIYQQIANIYKMNNELVARWASYAFADSQEHKDLKDMLAAFLLCQSRKGDPVMEDGKILFHDDDFRSVGEAMCLIYDKKSKNIEPKHLLRIRDILSLPGIASINKELGFGKSARKPFMGRWSKTVQKWLEYRETNPKLLEGLVKSAYKSTIKDLCRATGYKPNSAKFFEILRWKQVQAKDGRRNLALNVNFQPAESWEGLSETQICQRITASRPGYKRLVGLMPSGVKMTQAIMCAALEAGSFSDRDILQYSPSLEEFGLLKVPEIKDRWEKALKSKEQNSLRVLNIMKNMKNSDLKDKMQAAGEKILQKSVEEELRDMAVYVIIDISGSMSGALAKAKDIITKFLPAIPLDRLHVACFNTTGYLVEVKYSTKAGVEHALKNYSAGGGTNHASAIQVLKKYQPKSDQDVLFVWIGDQGEYGDFASEVQLSGLRPSAFAMVRVGNNGRIVQDTANILKIPFFDLKEESLQDPYALPRTLKKIIEATPIGTSTNTTTRVVREPLITKIINTKLLEKPAWA